MIARVTTKNGNKVYSRKGQDQAVLIREKLKKGDA